MTWVKKLNYWNYGEWDVVRERLVSLGEYGCSPSYSLLFRALDELELDQIKVVFLGQDPYPRHDLATGRAFEVPGNEIPQSLDTLFKEYVRDLGYPYPTSGKLNKWVDEGVLLWNTIPSCLNGKSLSHQWPEWELLTREILETLSKNTNCIFVAFGKIAQDVCKKYVSEDDNTIINMSHPSARGQRNGRWPMQGSRLFSTINVKLVENGLEPIDWKLE